MNIIKFTPGPWTLKIQYGIGFINSKDWDQLAGVIVKMTGDRNIDPIGMANAHLITAAPDMYEILHDIATAHGPGTLASDELFERMNTVLLKAGGEEL